MFRRVLKGSRSWALLAGTGAFFATGLASVPQAAAQVHLPDGRQCPTPAYPIPHATPGYPTVPGIPGAVTPGMPTPGAPTPGAPTPGAQTPGAQTPDSSLTPRTPDGTGTSDLSGDLGLAASGTSIAAGGGAFAASGAAASATGYLDNPIPITTFRVRYDSAYDNNRPDRAEFFYGKCGCFRVLGADPNAPGPPAVETKVDYQDIRAYLEAAFDNRASAFVELPVRFLNPEKNENATGFGDMNAGFKYAVIACPERYVTFQFRTYIPTGDADRGLGTNHVSLEPGVLLQQQLSDRLILNGEVQDWIPISGTDFAGNVLRYGVGLTYIALDSCNYRVMPVAEFVGWTVLDGKDFAVPGNNTDPMAGRVQDASGDTIVNAKLGVRFGFGEAGPGSLSQSSLYVGYGRALTGDVWYKDVLRVEYRLTF